MSETNTTTTTTTTKLTRSEQARINGAKSKGPITAEGKAKSSKNSLKHGFAAQVNVLLAPEDSEAWKTHLAGYRASFNNPTNLFESDLVDQLASIAWRKSRLIALETSILDFQLSIQSDAVERLFPDNADDPNFHLVLAWQALARKAFTEEVENPTIPPQNLDGLSIELVRRYQTSLDRQFRNAFTSLRQYRKDFPPTPPSAATTTLASQDEPELKPETAPQTTSTNRPGVSYNEENCPKGGSVPACTNSSTLPSSINAVRIVEESTNQRVR